MPAPQHTPTEALVRRAREGDREAFDELASQFRDRVAAWVASRIGPQLRARVSVDDVIQETFLWALQGIARLEWRGEESFNHWLISIAKHVISREADRQERHPMLALDCEVAGGGVSPSKALRRGERFDRLEKAMRDLSPEHRRVIELARIERLPVQEIARRLGRSPNATSQLLSRALKKLRASFGDTESLGLPERSLDLKEGGKDEE